MQYTSNFNRKLPIVRVFCGLRGAAREEPCSFRGRRADGLLRANRWKDAEKDATLSLDLQPGANAKAYFRRALARRQLGKLDRAKEGEFKEDERRRLCVMYGGELMFVGQISRLRFAKELAMTLRRSCRACWRS